jgi:hypothetical protein
MCGCVCGYREVKRVVFELVEMEVLSAMLRLVMLLLGSIAGASQAEVLPRR